MHRCGVVWSKVQCGGVEVCCHLIAGGVMWWSCDAQGWYGVVCCTGIVVVVWDMVWSCDSH